MESTVESLMSRDLITVGRKTSVVDVAVMMRDRDIGAIVVVEDHRPVGIVTERDFVKTVAEDCSVDMPVEEIMSSPVVTVSKDTLLSDALEIMTKKKIRRLPITDDGRLIGIVTTRDIFPRYIDSLLESFNRIYDILENIK
jgi:CBS domain-containing protein